MFNCLVGCVKNYTCPNTELQQPVEGDMLAPFVRVYFDSPNDPTVTVGNHSSPDFDNHAVIKSFQFGGSNGMGVTVEIIDEMGGPFQHFVDKLNKCMKNASSDYTMRCQWGWIITNCDGSNDIAQSPPITVQPLDLDVQFADGKIKFIITGTDLIQDVALSRQDEIHGDDSAKIPLKEAIRRLAKDTEPSFDVKFVRIEPDGTESEWGFDQFGFDGPENVYASNGENKVSTIQRWIEPYLTDRKKGIFPVWDSIADTPTLALMEDPKPGCDENASCLRSIGTWIVGGGACSPVISFNPTINWKIGYGSMSGATGNAGGAATGESIKKEKPCDNIQTRETGLAENVSFGANEWNTLGPRQGPKAKAEAQDQHAKANSSNSPNALQPIEAELKLQGDPRPEFCNIMTLSTYLMSIVVVNPFHLFAVQGDDCGDWLAKPGCNEVLSNRSWMPFGVDHSIKEGSYVTTIKVRLPVPGIDLDANDPIGGADSGGYTPDNVC